MTKNEYLIGLAVELEKTGADNADIKRAVEFCREMMDDMMEDGMTEEQAVSSMGEPGEIAERMKEEGMPEEADAPAFEAEISAGAGQRRVHRVFDPSAIREISVIDDNNAVCMVSGGEFSVDYTQSGDDIYIAEVKGGVLTVRFIDGRRKLGLLQRIFTGSPKREKLVVTVPASWGGGASLRTSNASIDVRDVRLSGLVAHTGNSRVTVENVRTAQTVVIKTSNSRVTAENIEASEVTIKTSNARIEAREIRAEGNIAFVSSNGRITAENVSGKEAVLSTSNGRIEVQNIDAEYIKLASSNGGISGTAAGKASDYSVTARTSNGGNNLKNSASGPRVLEVITSNGGINVGFTG